MSLHKQREYLFDFGKPSANWWISDDEDYSVHSILDQDYKIKIWSGSKQLGTTKRPTTSA